jgi:hypothetical protein
MNERIRKLAREAGFMPDNFPSLAGMTEAERRSLWNTMAQIFDNDIMPNMEFRHG